MLLFEGDLTKKLDPKITNEIEKVIKKRLGNKEGQVYLIILQMHYKTRSEF